MYDHSVGHQVTRILWPLSGHSVFHTVFPVCGSKQRSLEKSQQRMRHCLLRGAKHYHIKCSYIWCVLCKVRTGQNTCKKGHRQPGWTLQEFGHAWDWPLRYLGKVKSIFLKCFDGRDVFISVCLIVYNIRPVYKPVEPFYILTYISPSTRVSIVQSTFDRVPLTVCEWKMVKTAR